MSKFNVQQTHPLIPNSNSYVIEKKYVSIHSQDRDITSFPESTLFEIDLPQSYENVQSIRLSTWSFPANYSVFSVINNNLFMIFSFVEIYNPKDHGVTDPLQLAIYEALTYKSLKDSDASKYRAQIQEGFYNPDQMANELEARMNRAVTREVEAYFTITKPEYKYLLDNFNGYNQFVVAYNSVSQKLNFGNKSSSFRIDNSSDIYFTENLVFNNSCKDQRKLPEFDNWGLPAFLGFTRISQTSVKGTDPDKYNFFYGDAKIKGDGGKWLSSNLPGAVPWYLVAPAKINFMGPAYFYMEVSTGNTSLNCIDETNPYNISKFTLTTNQTNSRVNSSLAKLAIPTTPIAQWFDNSDQPYKWFSPPAERISRLGFKIRYHNGQLVRFGSFNYSFLLELTIVHPLIQTDLSKNIPTFTNTFG